MKKGNDKLKTKNCNNCKFEKCVNLDDIWFEKCFICILSNKWMPINN